MLTFIHVAHHCRASQVVLVVKNPPANAGDIETLVWSLGGEDPLEKGMATHSIFLAWRIPWTEEPGGLQSIGRKEVDMTKATEHSAVLRWAEYLQCGCYWDCHYVFIQ